MLNRHLIYAAAIMLFGLPCAALGLRLHGTHWGPWLLALAACFFLMGDVLAIAIQTRGHLRRRAGKLRLGAHSAGSRQRLSARLKLVIYRFRERPAASLAEDDR
jgi:hypothetical protein